MHHHRTLSRRSFAAGAVALTGSAIASHRILAQTADQSADTQQVAVLGSTQEEWNISGGEPKPAGDFYMYESAIGTADEVLVGFTDGIATFMEYRFAGEGIPHEEASELLAYSIPSVAMMGERFHVPGVTEETGAYSVSLFALDAKPPTQGAIGVMALASAEPTANVSAISICIASAPEIEVPVTGDPGGISLDRDAWIAAKGDPEQVNYETETYLQAGPEGMPVTTWYMPQDDVIQHLHANGDQLDVLAATRNAGLEFVGQSIPADSQMLQHFYLPGTKGGPLALRVATFASEEASTKLNTKGGILAMLHEREDDPEPMVTRIDLGMSGM